MYNIYKMYLIQRKVILKIRRHQHVARSPSQNMDKDFDIKQHIFQDIPLKGYQSAYTGKEQMEDNS